MTTVKGTLNVDKAVTLDTTLNVTGDTTIEGIVNAKGTNSYFNGKVGVGLQPTNDDYAEYTLSNWRS